MSSERVHAARSLLAELLDHEFSDETLCSVSERGTELPHRLWEQVLLGPVRDFLDRPGKHVRADMVRHAWLLSGGQGSPPAALPLVVECLHAGALIVDDIADDSTHRRGLTSLHRRYGVPLALNAGNWLYFWALTLLEHLPCAPSLRLEVNRRVARTLLRCHYGQALDVGVRIGSLAQDEVMRVVAATTALKTGALLELSAELGALAAGAPRERVRAIGRFGAALGTGLQMLDDCGNLSGGKDPAKRWEDLRLGRATWPWAWLATDLDVIDFNALQGLARGVTAGRCEPDVLARAMRIALDERGRRRAQEHLQTSLAALRAAVGQSPHLAGVEQQIARLEGSYG